MRLIWTVGAYAGQEADFPPHIGARMLDSGRARRVDETGGAGTGDTGDAALPEGSTPADSQSSARPTRSRRRA